MKSITFLRCFLGLYEMKVLFLIKKIERSTNLKLVINIILKTVFMLRHLFSSDVMVIMMGRSII